MYHVKYIKNQYKVFNKIPERKETWNKMHTKIQSSFLI